MRFYFHLRDGETLIEDLEGIEFATFEIAYAEAINSARELMATRLKAGCCIDDSVFEIYDEDRQLLRSIPFEEALPPG